MATRPRKRRVVRYKCLEIKRRELMGSGASINNETTNINNLLEQWFRVLPNSMTIQHDIQISFGIEISERISQLIANKVKSLQDKDHKTNCLRRYILYLLDDLISPSVESTVKEITSQEGPFGVSLQFIYHFIDKYQITETMTTAEVVRDIIIPETSGSQQTFLDAKLREKYPLYWSDFQTGYRGFEQSIGGSSFKRHAFVSHAWAMPFRTMIDAVQQAVIRTWQSSITFFMLYTDCNYVEECDHEVILWLDVFCKNQHIPSPAMDEFYRAMQTPGEVIAVFYPTISPIAVSRIWCLFELFTAIKLNIAIKMANVDGALYTLIVEHHSTKRLKKDESDWTRFRKLGHDRIIEYIQQFLIIDVNSAQATVPSDIDLILGLIKESVGVEEMNHTIYKFMADDIIERDALLLCDPSPACFDGESFVTILSKGNIIKRAVKDLSVGDKVLTEAGHYQRIELITIDYIPDGILEMCLTKEGVYITPEHPIFMKSSGWILPKEIYKVKKYPIKQVYNIELDQSGSQHGNAVCLNESLIAITLGHNLNIFPETDQEYGWGWRENPLRMKYL